MRFIFLRHPQTVANEMGYIYGKKDYPYTILGEKQLIEAVKLSDGFTYDRIISSPIGRAKRLAEAVAVHSGSSLSEAKELEEMGYGILEGLTIEEGKTKYPEVMDAFMEGDPSYTIPEGETSEGFFERIQSFLDDHLQGDESLLIVSHGGVIRTAIEYLLDTEPGFSWQLEVGNGSFVEINCEDGYHRLKNMMNQG